MAAGNLAASLVVSSGNLSLTGVTSGANLSNHGYVLTSASVDTIATHHSVYNGNGLVGQLLTVGTDFVIRGNTAMGIRLGANGQQDSLTIDSSENVAITGGNLTVAAGDLTVSAGYGSFTDSTTRVLRLNHTGSGAFVYQSLYNAGVEKWRILGDHSDSHLSITTAASIKAISFDTAGNVDMPSGDLTLTAGDLVIGTSGKGIDFSATSGAAGMTSELLDDYEEGTWAPVYTPQTGTFTTMTMDALDCVYTKAGRMVTVSGIIRTDSVDTTGASGNLTIAGLPFTASHWSAGSIGRSTAFGGDYPSMIHVGGGTSVLNLNYRSTSNGTSITLNVSDLATGVTADQNYIIIECTYQTDE